MRNLWKVGALGAVFGAVLSVGGCSDFDAAYENCQGEGRCGPQASGDGGPDAGDAGDGGDVTPPPCGDGGVDYPDLTGFDNDCDGIDGVADAGYFVHPTDGRDDGNDGTRERPFQTLARALREIRDGGTGRNIVYLGTGTYNEPAPVVDVPVSLYGGYTWRGNQFWDRFKDGGGTTFFDGGTIPFTVRDVAGADVLLEGLTIASADALNAGEPSIALRVIGSQNVVLRKVFVAAGNGAPGSAGTNGGVGLDGGAGNTGSDSSSSISVGGNGGASSCEATRVGGQGGGNLPTQPGDMGADGGPNGGGGRGGDGGAQALVTDAGCNDFECTCNAPGGAAGIAGAKGGNGSAGPGGTGDGAIAGGMWVAGASGQDGQPGKPGTGGGGGGAGGSCKAAATQIATGGGGGGGGGAGCGGQEGKGGGNGGASIALLVSDAQVTVEATTSLQTGTGGMGGRGGAGGQGGVGGAPGPGGKTMPPITGKALPGNPDTRDVRTTGGAGGQGGVGGEGGQGGPGGGGRGGPSVVSWCVNGGVTFESQPTYVLGSGGAGGVSDGGVDGTEGISQFTVGCPTP
ncbi:hypothetical protein [Corallococcus sp. AB018]|uniref:hypothetical protein n=1 Tax=Corallococcus sp. AB018 TaxID=2316715 RepID=UPI0018F43565|nr:hypothetical protein [Corallococcus sp. AB018]